MHKHIGVRYIYEDSNRAGLSARKDRGGEMTATDFMTLLESLVADLKLRILNADRDLMESSSEQIQLKDAVLGSAIANCIDNFEIDNFDGGKVLKLISQTA